LPTFFKCIVKVTKAKDFVGSTHYIWLFSYMWFSIPVAILPLVIFS